MTPLQRLHAARLHDASSTKPTAAASAARWRHVMRMALDRAEPLIEWIIRLCGWSAILFVFSIFFFVFLVAAPVLFGKLNWIEFFTSTALAAVVRRASDIRHAGPAGRHARRSRRWRWCWPCRWGWARRSSSPSSAAASSRRRSKSSSSCWRPFRRSSGDSSATWCSGPLIIELTGAAGGRESAQRRRSSWR